VTVADDIALGNHSVVDDGLVGRSGRFQYRVVAMRRGATGSPVTSDPGEAAVQVGAPPPTTTPPTTAFTPSSSSGGVRVGSIGRSGGVAPPPTLGEVDTGFEETLDYEEAEVGDEQAVPPVDAGFFDIDEEQAPVGQGLAVPIAVGLCLVVWAGHLRHLARRAAPPLH
jgi:hypothetical protein